MAKEIGNVYNPVARSLSERYRRVKMNAVPFLNSRHPSPASLCSSLPWTTTSLPVSCGWRGRVWPSPLLSPLRLDRPLSSEVPLKPRIASSIEFETPARLKRPLLRSRLCERGGAGEFSLVPSKEVRRELGAESPCWCKYRLEVVDSEWWETE